MTYYDDLGVPNNADQDTIKRAYRKLAMQNHPDKGGDPEKFKKISEAYETIGDPDKRHQYDNPQPTGGFPFPFGDMFTQRPPAQHLLKISLEDAFHGRIVNLNIGMRKKCTCSRTCHTCGGRGSIGIEIMPMMIIQQPCHGCNGKKVVLVGCKECSGTGQREVKERVSISLPPGVQNGHTEILKGMGNDEGDLHIVVHVSDHPVFKREGQDLVITRKISLLESLIGLHIGISHFGGDLLHHQPGPIDPRKRYCIKGKGMPRGDLWVVYDVHYREEFSIETREKLKCILHEY